MIEVIDIETLLKKKEDLPLVDVRSPVEFEKGHIPGSLNIPLFSNDERAAIGTLYKQKGQAEAIVLGESFAVPKIDWYISEVRKVAKGGPVLITCFRGGLRSRRFTELLDEKGFDILRLEKGYKSYRKAARNYLSADHGLLVLGGRTGSGKTDVLRELENSGEAVVDLEGLANHRGSAFGSIGLGKQPTTEQFENNLFERIRKLEGRSPLWTEDESVNIGRVFMPEEFFKVLKSAPLIVLDLPSDLRVERLCREYAQCGREPLLDAVDRIKKRLGGERTAQTIKAIEEGDLSQAAALVLNYYDRCYDFGLERDKVRTEHILKLSTGDPSYAAVELLKLEKQLFSNS